MGNSPQDNDKQRQNQNPVPGQRPGQGTTPNPQNRPEDQRHNPGHGDDQQKTTDRPKQGDFR